MIQYLNRDNLYEISKYLSNENRYLLYTSIYDDNKANHYFNLIIMKLQLIYKLNRKIKIFKNMFCKEISKYFNQPCYFNKNCIFYAPVVPSGKCRFCYQYENKHKIREKNLNIMFSLWQNNIS